jgi:hypothetical protein
MAASGGGFTGWNPQWTYDRCDGFKPPPCFFTVAGWFAANQ